VCHEYLSGMYIDCQNAPSSGHIVSSVRLSFRADRHQNRATKMFPLPVWTLSISRETYNAKASIGNSYSTIYANYPCRSMTRSSTSS
jgi:hypothetical protein